MLILQFLINFLKVLNEKASPQAIAGGFALGMIIGLTPTEAAQSSLGKETAHFALENLKEHYDPEKLITLDSLSSAKKIREEKDRLAGVSAAWQSRVDGLDVEGVSQRAKAFEERVKSEKFSGVEGLRKAQSLIVEGKTLKADFEKTQQNFNDVKASLRSEIGRSQEVLADIERLKKEDIDGRLDFVKGGFSAEGVTRGLLGPRGTGKIDTGLAWFHKVRKLMPEKK